MRFLFAILAAVTVASCITPDDDRFHVGQSERAFVIIGLAEAAENTSARYSMLWRRLDETGAFARFANENKFEAETNARGSIRARGIPGEFLVFEIEPGTYALDGVFALIAERRVNYVADGLIAGPERPSFDVRAGEAIYLGIWQLDINDARSVTRVWRLDDSDLRAALDESDVDLVSGNIRLREVTDRAVPCEPRRLSNLSQRRIC